MEAPPSMEPEEILRAAVASPGEGTLGDLAMQADRVQGVLEKLDEDELRRSYATLVRIVGGADKGESPDEGGSPLAAVSAVLGRMRMGAGRPSPASKRGADTQRPAGGAPRSKAAAPPGTGPDAASPDAGAASGAGTRKAAAPPYEGDLDAWDRELAALRRAIAERRLTDARAGLSLLDALREAAEEASTFDRPTLDHLQQERDAAARQLADAEFDIEAGDPDPDPGQDPSAEAEAEAPPADPRALLLDVPGRALPFAALADALAPDGVSLLAPTLLRLLHRAAGSAEALHLPAPGDPTARVRVVTPAAFLLAALAEGGEEEEAPGSIAAGLRGHIEKLSAIPDALRRDDAFDPAREDGAELLVGPALRAILARAAQLAAEVRGASTAPGRKFALAALVLSPQGRQAFADLGMIRGAPAGYFEDLGLWLADWLAEDDARHDRRDWARWMQDHPQPPAERLLDGLDLRQPLRLSAPDYAADDVARRRGAQASMLEGDRLGVAADARALADLICLEAARPPLAIGLFGPWGSGKSTFMRMIEEAAEANRETAARMREAGAAPPFVESVAHVWFNAWHYLDANLWASLVSHIFRELHRLSRGADAQEARRMDYLVEKLASAAQAETAAREGVRAAELSVTRARRRVAAADRLRACLRRKLAEAAPRALDELLAQETRDGLAALREAGVTAPLRSVEQLQDLRRELSGLGGRLRLTGSAILRGGARTWGAAALALAALGGGGALAAWLGQGGDWAPGWLTSFLAEAAGWLGVAGGLAALVTPHLRRANAAMDALAAAEEEARTRLAAAEAKRRRLEADLARLEGERLRAQDDLDARRRERERLEAMRRGEQPAELLAQFIEERARAEGYRKHLGLLSQIRADFELMADLLAPRSPAAREDAAKRIAADPAELPRIGRIVLYVDDLDRCRDEQVVEVLEAIHLLLAFDLFVVVVGVDARWVEGALTRFYAQQLSPGETADGRPSVADYLEKIFQIPFRLRPMELGEGGGYSRLVAEIVGPVQETAADPDDPSEAPFDAAPPPEADAPGAEGPPPLPAIDLSSVWPAAETPAQVLERVTLTRPELEAIEALGPLVGRSPRTTKRFVNLYRLLRSRRQGEALEAFLDAGGLTTDFECTLFWLALETGLTATERDRLNAVAVGPVPAWAFRLNGVIAPPTFEPPPPPVGDGGPGEEPETAFWRAVASVERRQTLHQGFASLSVLDPDRVASILAEASRYSFRLGGAI